MSIITIFAPITVTSGNSYVMNAGSTTNGASGFEMMHTTKNPTSGANIYGSYNYQSAGVGAKSTGVATTPNAVQVFATVFDDSANTLVAYVDSTGSISQGSGGGTNRSKTSLKIGVGDYDGTGGFFGQGRLVELIMTKNALTTDDVQNLLTYRNQNYLDVATDNFITAAGITNPTIIGAVNTLVADLRTYNIWDKLQAIYPLVGGTSGSMKWNLKDPQDTNAAYRLDCAGTGWTFDASGSKQSDSSTTYANTFYAVNTNDNTDGMSMGVYINGGTNTQGYDLGRFDGTDDIALIAGFGNNTFYVNYVSTSYITTGAFTMPNGFFVANNDGTNTKGYRNGTEVSTGAETRNLTDTGALYLGNRNGGPDAASDRRYAFAFIGKSLNGTEQSNLYTAVQKFETTLGRQV